MKLFFKSHKVLVFYLAVAVLGLLLGMLSFFSVTSIHKESVVLQPEDFSSGEHGFGYRVLDRTDEKRAAYETRISRQALEGLGGGDYAVVISQLSSQAYSVYFNGAHIGTVGDMRFGRSNIWNTVHSFLVDSALAADENVLRIDTLAEYQTGLSAPVAVTAASRLPHYMGKAGFFTEGINFIGLGFLVFGAITIFMLYLVSEPKNPSFLYFCLSLLMLGVYTLDYTGFYSLPFDYIVYKKIIMGGIYVGAALVSLGMYKFFHSRLNLWLSIVTAAGYALIVIFTPDMIAFKSCYMYFNFIFVPILAGWLWTSLKHFKKTDEAKMFFFGVATVALFTLADLVSALSGVGFSLNTSFMYAVVFSMTTVILLLQESLNKDMQMQIIGSAHRESYLASITDGMTGLYNRRHMTQILKQVKPPYSVAMLDIDDFKEINDTYGHRFGDRIIRYIASNLVGHVRSSDYVFRYGGDEFVVIFPGCPPENAKTVVEKIAHLLKQHSLEYEDKTVPVTFSGGVYYVETPQDADIILDRVDNPLYKSKKEGKDRVAIFALDP